MSAEELPLTTPTPLPEQAGTADTRPAGLTLASVSRDGKRMLFVDQAGHEFVVEVDERLQAVLPAGSSGRTEGRAETRGRSETRMNDSSAKGGGESSLRPRDIQIRIRAGESVEAVAAAAGTTVEKIMPFAGPVLGERVHMAERAQKGSLRRTGESTVRTLGEAVAAQLHTLYLEPEVVSWDSFRRPDGRWQLVASYETPARSGEAQLIFDVPGNYVSIENDDARWLVGDLVDAPEASVEAVRDELLEVRRRRSVPSVTVIETVETTVETTTISAEVPLEQPIEAFLDGPATALEAPAAAEIAEPKRSARKKRSSVPSWDEIMFGGGADEPMRTAGGGADEPGGTGGGPGSAE